MFFVYQWYLFVVIVRYLYCVQFVLQGYWDEGFLLGVEWLVGVWFQFQVEQQYQLWLCVYQLVGLLLVSYVVGVCGQCGVEYVVQCFVQCIVYVGVVVVDVVVVVVVCVFWVQVLQQKIVQGGGLVWCEGELLVGD